MPQLGFDKKRWQKIIRRSEWYIEYAKFAYQAINDFGEKSKELEKLNKNARNFFKNELQAGRVSLATSGPDWDEERQPIDTVVIHHTSSKPGYQLSHMEATQLLNIYASYYAHSYDNRDKSVKGQPIWSNHFRKGRQTFLVYHWLMRMNGRFKRLLHDDQIGWQAGNWDINRRSIAICLDNDYENQDPDTDILQKLAGFIKKNYPDIKPENIIGHCEARRGTVCPGTNFLDGWKLDLLKYLQ